MKTASVASAGLEISWWEQLKAFPALVWVVLFGTFISRLSYLMAWPFLVVFLYRDYGASETYIGAVLAASALVSGLAGTWMGYVSDKWGRKGVMISGGILSALTYAGIGSAHALWQFFVLMLAVGMMRPSLENPAKALLSDQFDSPKARELAQNARYFLVNAGGAIGPLLGIVFGLSHPQKLFYITGAVYLLYTLILLLAFMFCALKSHPLANSAQRLNLAQVVGVLRRDHLLGFLLIADILMLVAYSQYESSLPQVVTHSGIAQAGKWVGALILVNTVTIVVLQFPLLILLSRYALATRIRIGVALMAIAQPIFIFSGSHLPLGWLVGVFFLSAGESIVFPSMNVLIDTIAPENLRGTYFGVASLSILGFALGPLLGGWVLEYFGSGLLFSGCFVLVLASLALFGCASRRQRAQ